LDAPPALIHADWLRIAGLYLGHEVVGTNFHKVFIEPTAEWQANQDGQVDVKLHKRVQEGKSSVLEETSRY